MEQNPNLLSTELHIDGITEKHLSETARWARFLGIVGFVASVLFGILSFFLPMFLAKSTQNNPYGNAAVFTGAMTGMLTIIYLLIAVFMFVVSWFIYKFGTSTKAALRNHDQDLLNHGLLNLKRVFRIYGVITIFYLGMLVLGLLIVMIASIG